MRRSTRASSGRPRTTPQSQIGLWITRVQHRTGRQICNLCLRRFRENEAWASSLRAVGFSHNVADVGLGVDEQSEPTIYLRSPRAKPTVLGGSPENQQFHRFSSLTRGLWRRSRNAQASSISPIADLVRRIRFQRALSPEISNLRRYGKDRQTVAALYSNSHRSRHDSQSSMNDERQTTEDGRRTMEVRQ